MKKFYLGLMLLLSPLLAFSQQKTVEVIVNCADSSSEDFIFEAADFVTLLTADEALGPVGVKLVSEVSLPTAISGQGRSLARSASKVQVLSLSMSSLKSYFDKRQNEKDSAFPTPASLAGVLEEFQMMTDGGCDFHVPTRFSQIFNSPEKGKSLSEVEAELKSCSEKLEKLQAGKGIVDTLNSDVKSIEKKIENKQESSSKANQQ